MGRPYLWMFMLRSNDAMPRVVPAMMFGFVDRCRAWFGKQRVLGIWFLSIIVNFKLKQKMQTWPYRLRRNPRMYLEQAPSGTPLALLSLPDRAGNGSVVCRLGGCKSPEEGQKR
jgi:hypothetical protein